MKSICLLFNPVAGRGIIRSRLADIIELYSKSGYRVICAATGASGNARKMVSAMNLDDGDYDSIVCCGGDGTLDEVVSGMLSREDGRQIPIGYIPCGSTNDFARSLGLPEDPLDAAKIVLEGEDRKTDVGCMNGTEYFTYVAAFGLFVDVSYSTPQESKNIWGHSAYIMEGVKELFRQGGAKPVHTSVVSGAFSGESDYGVGMITNSRSVGGFEGITGKHVDLSDGLFEVTLIRIPRDPIHTREVLNALTTSSWDSTDDIDHFKTDHLRITTPQPTAWTRDGEYGGDHVTCDLTVLKHAVTIRVPAK